MITEQNKAIVTRFNKEFIEAGNMQTFEEIIADDFINQTAPAGAPKGPEGVVYFFNYLLRPAFPDLKVTIHDQVAEGDRVTTRKSFYATHLGEFFGVPATHKPVVMEVIDIIRLRDGKFVEHWNVLDWQSVMAQLTH
ncbi:MAG: ester cyclase [Spirosomataceae bacterium]